MADDQMTATPKDLQDEVRRLRAVLEKIAEHYTIDGDCTTCVFGACQQDVHDKDCPLLLAWQAIQIPPESADEYLHPRIYTAQDGHRFCDECEAYLGEESPPQACKHPSGRIRVKLGRGFVCLNCDRHVRNIECDCPHWETYVPNSPQERGKIG